MRSPAQSGCAVGGNNRPESPRCLPSSGWDTEPGWLARSGSELGERNRERSLDWHRDEGEVEELVRVGAHQASGIADAGVAAPIRRQREEIAEELLDAQRGAKLDRVGTLDLGPKGVDDLRRNPDLPSRPDPDPVPSPAHIQCSGVDDEPLLLEQVDVRRPAVRALRPFDLRPPHLLGGAVVPPDRIPRPSRISVPLTRWD